ncbi:ATPase [Methanocaldococcus villosus KIN24-T80]|uniref:ATPase n=1 Tax=Methanocaldococcus villosus KIN24-T80 TaxID=1069083 RepID=N6W001_9EURY|nr:AAA family ATPase [Methanocaldococcus villosus]ENN96672.1 ATPase [Methanocaldococcus villosus KIN24-T80]
MLQKIREELNSYFLERREEIDIALTSILAGEHTLFLGPPGTAKSQLIRAIAEHINANYFEKLITRFTTEDEIFGPLSIKELKENDRYVRKTEGYLPKAEVAFLDEIFKANSSILNSLLSIINERIYHNGDKIEKVPLISLFSASNELPEESELLAFYDRFLFRKIVRGIRGYNNLIRLLDLEDYKAKTKIEIDELKELQKEAMDVKIDNIKEDIIKIKLSLEGEGINISDRRLKKAVKAIKCYSYLNGKEKAEIEDLEILRFIFWNEPEEFYKTSIEIFKISNHFSGYAFEQREILNSLVNELKNIDKERIKLGGVEYRKCLEILGKLNSMVLTLKEVRAKAIDENKPHQYIDDTIEEIYSFKKYVEELLK